MIYAIRQWLNGRQTLVEFESLSELRVQNHRSENGLTEASFKQVSRTHAARWVTDGKEHETGLFIDDDGMVVYAPKEA